MKLCASSLMVDDENSVVSYQCQ